LRVLRIGLGIWIVRIYEERELRGIGGDFPQ
jgi:hypothetical protein